MSSRCRHLRLVLGGGQNYEHLFLPSYYKAGRHGEAFEASIKFSFHDLVVGFGPRWLTPPRADGARRDDPKEGTGAPRGPLRRSGRAARAILGRLRYGHADDAFLPVRCSRARRERSVRKHPSSRPAQRLWSHAVQWAMQGQAGRCA